MSSLFDDGPTTDLIRDAELSPCGMYRLSLTRSWLSPGENHGLSVCFVMLNPSTADALEDDPTIRRCMSFARAWGYSRLVVRNLFTMRATDPQELLRATDPVGPGGDDALLAARECDLVVAAWGAGPRGIPRGRDREALRLLAGVPIYCLGVTKGGQPRHPLYLRADAQLILWM